MSFFTPIETLKGTLNLKYIPQSPYHPFKGRLAARGHALIDGAALQGLSESSAEQRAACEARDAQSVFEGYMGGSIGVILGLYRDNGKENGNYHLGLRV